ncbi:mucin-5AC [Drosophila mojavensis]|uniref:mucin-5AC n=1 Tax=Drosophila mojavensis TaxID=7230 RepID=UPI001CD0C9B5|nr:mucin-5AC [Drosophila mojavensis]
MEALSSWTLALLRLLSALPGSWAWTPARTPYSLAHSYLDAAQRPLWILEDELMRRQARQDSDYATSTRATIMRRAQRVQRRQQRQHLPTAITIRVRPDSDEEVERLVAPPLATPSLDQRHYVLPHRVQLPSHYVQQLAQTTARPKPKPKPAQRRRQPQSLPIFDSAPGDNALPTASYPIFVYNGTRGELLLNTMLSAQRYPMQEPVPGQVLYPPSTPMFRPKPIVERLRLPGQRELLNLTLIPFYAHEAITMPPLTMATATATATSTSTSSTTGVAATAAGTGAAVSSRETYPTDPTPASAPATGPGTATASEPLALTTPMTTPYETQLPRSKHKRKAKKAKQYNAYRSPQEVVQWQPKLRSSRPLEPPDNHRHYVVATTDSSLTAPPEQQQLEQLDQLEAEIEDPVSQELELAVPSEAALLEETRTSTVSGAGSSPSSFQIVYVDESMEAPYDSLASTTEAPPLQRQSSRYALKREYFAFPVYTLGKLLRSPKPQRTSGMELDCSDSGSGSGSGCLDHEDNTWFILNSR